MSRSVVCIGVLALAVTTVTPCMATGPQPTNWPLDHIIANLQERLRIAPDDSRAEATEQPGASLGNPCGLELADGRVLPTYDWVLEAVP